MKNIKKIMIVLLMFSIAVEIYNITHLSYIKAFNTLGLENMIDQNPILTIYNFIYGAICFPLLYFTKYKKSFFTLVLIILTKGFVINKAWFITFSFYDSILCIIVLMFVLQDIVRKEMKLKKKMKINIS